MSFPFVDVHGLPLGPLTVQPFGALVGTGVVVGSLLASRRGARLGLPRAELEWFVTSMLLCGFVLSHVLDLLLYNPRVVLERPVELLILNRNLSSFGGFVGGLVGALVFRVVRKQPILPYVDCVLAVFPVAWIFGRAGCASAHDHVGRLTGSAWLGVRFPAHGPWPPGLRFDLGLLEMLATVPLAAIVWWFARRGRRAGAVAALVCLLYAPLRFGLDFLRATDFADADARYLRLTPAQWGCVLLLGVGVVLALRARRTPPPASAGMG